MNEDKLAEFLAEHKRNCENFNSEGNYDPNPYWLAEEIVKLFAVPDVSNNEVAVRLPHCPNKETAKIKCEWFGKTCWLCERTDC